MAGQARLSLCMHRVWVHDLAVVRTYLYGRTASGQRIFLRRRRINPPCQAACVPTTPAFTRVFFIGFFVALGCFNQCVPYSFYRRNSFFSEN